MKFLKRLYASLKHYSLPEVEVFGELCRMTGVWAFGPGVGGFTDLRFEVLPPGRHRGPRFVSWRFINEVSKCH
jgi:hypothetical protein